MGFRLLHWLQCIEYRRRLPWAVGLQLSRWLKITRMAYTHGEVAGVACLGGPGTRGALGHGQHLSLPAAGAIPE